MVTIAHKKVAVYTTWGYIHEHIEGKMPADGCGVRDHMKQIGSFRYLTKLFYTIRLYRDMFIILSHGSYMMEGWGMCCLLLLSDCCQSRNNWNSGVKVFLMTKRGPESLGLPVDSLCVHFI